MMQELMEGESPEKPPSSHFEFISKTPFKGTISYIANQTNRCNFFKATATEAGLLYTNDDGLGCAFSARP